MRRQLLTLAVALLACGPRTPSGAEPQNPQSAPAAKAPSALSKVAARIEVEPFEPLLLGGPSWAPEVLGVGTPATKDVAAELGAAHAALLEASRAGRTSAALAVALIRACWRAELVQQRGEVSIELLEALEQTYGVFDQPAYQVVEQSRRDAVVAFASERSSQGITLTERQLVDADRFIANVAGRAGAAQLRLIKLLLEEHADRPGAAAMAVRGARALVGVQDDVAVALVEASVGSGATEPIDASSALAGASVCFRALAPSCGEAALEHAGSSAGSERGAVEAMAKQAARALQLRDRADLASRTELGELLLELRRDDEAREVFETAHTQHPEDARPVAGLAKHAIMTRADFRGAYQLLERSGASENRDRSYYEVAIGTRAVSLAYDVLPRALAEGDGLSGAATSIEPYYRRLRADVVAYRELGASEADVLLFVLDGVFEVLPKIDDNAVLRERLSKLLPRAMELQRAAPTNTAAYRLLLLAAAFSTDQAGSLAVVRAEPAPALLVGDTGPRRISQWLDLALRWEAYGELNAIEAAANEGGAGARDPRLALVLGVIEAVRARTGGGSWQAAAGYFSASLQGQPSLATANNLVVALHELGRTEEALALLGELGSSENKPSIVKLNEAVVRGDLTSLAALCEGDADDAAAVACRWLQARANVPADRKRWALRSAEVEARAKATAIRSTPIPGRASAFPKGEFNFNMNYAPQVGLDLGISVTTSAWLVLTP